MNLLTALQTEFTEEELAIIVPYLRLIGVLSCDEGLEQVELTPEVLKKIRENLQADTEGVPGYTTVGRIERALGVSPKPIYPDLPQGSKRSIEELFQLLRRGAARVESLWPEHRQVGVSFYGGRSDDILPEMQSAISAFFEGYCLVDEQGRLKKDELLKLYLDREQRRIRGEDVTGHVASLIDELLKLAAQYKMVGDELEFQLKKAMDNTVLAADFPRYEAAAREIGKEVVKGALWKELEMDPSLDRGNAIPLALNWAIMQALGLKASEDLGKIGLEEYYRRIVDRVIEAKKEETTAQQIEDSLQVLEAAGSFSPLVAYVTKKGEKGKLPKPESAEAAEEFSRSCVGAGPMRGLRARELDRRLKNIGGVEGALYTAFSKPPYRFTEDGRKPLDLERKVTKVIEKFYGGREVFSNGRIFPGINVLNEPGSSQIKIAIANGLRAASVTPADLKNISEKLSVNPVTLFPTALGNIELDSAKVAVVLNGERWRAEVVRALREGGLGADRINEVLERIGGRESYMNLLPLSTAGRRKMKKVAGLLGIADISEAAVRKVVDSLGKDGLGGTLRQGINTIAPPALNDNMPFLLRVLPGIGMVLQLPSRVVASNLKKSNLPPASAIPIQQALALSTRPPYGGKLSKAAEALKMGRRFRDAARGLDLMVAGGAAGGPVGAVLGWVAGNLPKWVHKLNELTYMAYQSTAEEAKEAARLAKALDIFEFGKLFEAGILDSPALNSDARRLIGAAIQADWKLRVQGVVWTPDDAIRVIEALRMFKGRMWLKRMARIPDISDEEIDDLISKISGFHQEYDENAKLAKDLANRLPVRARALERYSSFFYRVSMGLNFLSGLRGLYHSLKEGKPLKSFLETVSTAANLAGLLGKKEVSKSLFGIYGKLSILQLVKDFIDRPVETIRGFIESKIKSWIIKKISSFFYQKLLAPLVKKIFGSAIVGVSKWLTGVLLGKAAVAGAGAATAAGVGAATAVGGAGAAAAAVAGGPPAWLIALIVVIVVLVCTTCTLSLTMSGPAASKRSTGGPGVVVPYEEQHFIVIKDDSNIAFTMSDENLVVGVSYPISIKYDGQGSKNFRIKSITDEFEGYLSNLAGKTVTFSIPTETSKPYPLNITENPSDPKIVSITGFPTEEFQSDKKMEISFTLKVAFSDTLDKFLEGKADGSMLLCNKLKLVVNISGEEKTFYDETCVSPNGGVERKEVCPFRVRTESIRCNQCPYCCGGSHVGSNSVDVDTSPDEKSAFEVVSPVDGVIEVFKENMLCRDKSPHHGDYVVIRADSDGLLYEFAHLEVDPFKISVGQKIKAGEHIGFWDVSLTEGPCWTGTHVHAGIKNLPDGQYADDVFRNRFKCKLELCICGTGNCYVCKEKK